jgi:putative SOS response-associated peptidase YedK
MCGRFAFYSPHEAVTRLFDVAAAPDIEPRYNIAPTQYVAAVRETGGPREVAMLHWGLVPSWAKDKAIGARMINARAETLTEKPSFRSAFRRRRCLVLADGYYEWQRSGTVKQPYFIGFADGAPFGMAGLWERWRDPASGEALESCCLVTTTPAAAVAQVHDRMPVIVPAEAYAEWLDPRNEATDRLGRLLGPCARPDIVARPVSQRVSNARNQGPDLIEQLIVPASDS